MNYQMTQKLELRNTVKMQSYDFEILKNLNRGNTKNQARIFKSHSENHIQNSEDSQNDEPLSKMMTDIQKKLTNPQDCPLTHINSKLNEFRRCIEVYDLVDHYQQQKGSQLTNRTEFTLFNQHKEESVKPQYNQSLNYISAKKQKQARLQHETKMRLQQLMEISSISDCSNQTQSIHSENSDSPQKKVQYKSEVGKLLQMLEEKVIDKKFIRSQVPQFLNRQMSKIKDLKKRIMGTVNKTLVLEKEEEEAYKFLVRDFQLDYDERLVEKGSFAKDQMEMIKLVNEFAGFMDEVIKSDTIDHWKQCQN